MKNKIIENIREELSQLEDIEQAPCDCCGRVENAAYKEIEVGEEYLYIQYNEEIENFVLETPTDEIPLWLNYCPRCGRKL